MKNVRYIKDYFLDIVCGDMIENSKPAPDIYLKACELISVEPKNDMPWRILRMVCYLHIGQDVNL